MFSDRKALKSDRKATKSGWKIRFSFFMNFFEFLNFETEKFEISPENSFRIVPETEIFFWNPDFPVGKFFPGLATSVLNYTTTWWQHPPNFFISGAKSNNLSFPQARKEKRVASASHQTSLLCDGPFRLGVSAMDKTGHALGLFHLSWAANHSEKLWLSE